LQEAIGRNQDETQSIELYRHCRQEGFTGINFDLIYGLPRQTIAGFQETLRKVIELRPDRVALYSFAHLPEGRANQQKIDIASLPTPQVKSDLFNLARETFVGNGYFQIGMDHFVLPGDELAVAASNGKLRRNFMGYTVNAARDWVGIGMSSISYISNNFAQNQSGISSYNSAIDENRFAVYRGMKLSEDDLIRQHVISELMCNFRLDITELEGKFGIVPTEYLAEEFQQLKPFLDDGLLNWEEKVLTVGSAGKLFVRNVAMTFDAYLKSNRPEKSKVQFSRTI
jgi:oxygen-independent coproporphyrinogen-3 oxidase